MVLEEKYLQALYAWNQYHRSFIEKHGELWCYYCQKKSACSWVKQWIDPTLTWPEGATAVCPQCGIDACLPNRPELELDMDTIAQMNKYWFGKWTK